MSKPSIVANIILYIKLYVIILSRKADGTAPVSEKISATESTFSQLFQLLP